MGGCQTASRGKDPQIIHTSGSTPHAGGPELCCKRGHLVTKLTKLRPWQGHVVERQCSGCSRIIDRRLPRWRCQEQCTWDLCQGCYERHWADVVYKASRTESPSRRAELLRAVPEDRRPDDSMLMAGRLEKRPRPESVAKLPPPESGREKAQTVLLLVAAWVCASLLASFAASRLLSGDAPLFPDAWLLSGVAHAGSFVVCRLAARACKYNAAGDREAVDMTSAAVLGLMCGLECGLYCGVFSGRLAGEQHEAYMLKPIVMGVAGLLSGTEQARWKLGVSIAFAAVGGLFAVGGTVDWPGIQAALPWVSVAGFVTMFRWVFSLNVLPSTGGLPPLCFLAGQLFSVCTAMGFELAFMTHMSSYRALLHLPNPQAAAGLLAAAAIGSGVQLVVELRLAQLTSLATLGLLAPLLNVAGLAFALLTSSASPTVLSAAGVALYAVALAVYWHMRRGDAAAAAGQGYQKLEAGSAKSAMAPRRVTRPDSPPPVRSDYL